MKNRAGKIFTIFCIALLLAACSAETEPASDSDPSGETNRKTSRIEASGFSLKVNAPTVVEAGELIQVEAVLTHNGEEAVDLYHGDPIIRLSYSGDKGIKEYNDIGRVSTLPPGDKKVVKETFKTKKPGAEKVSATTTSLKVDGEYIEGKGNEKAVTDDMGEISKNAAQSKLRVDPIETEAR
ncbi:hypothetical protein [Salibacterium aidingense]|uniref:hypothetical protein n=1 Tax=Salibacterium aidingense TaxID=384933 RepID=UPI003BD63171